MQTLQSSFHSFPPIGITTLREKDLHPSIAHHLFAMIFLQINVLFHHYIFFNTLSAIPRTPWACWGHSIHKIICVKYLFFQSKLSQVASVFCKCCAFYSFICHVKMLTVSASVMTEISVHLLAAMLLFLSEAYLFVLFRFFFFLSSSLNVEYM